MTLLTTLCRSAPPVSQRAALLAAGFCVAALLAGCSVVHVNGSWTTPDDKLCLLGPNQRDPQLHALLKRLLRAKRFEVMDLPAGAKPAACRQTLVYRWGVEQYYVPAVVKQYPAAFDFYLGGEKIANASFDPTRNLISPHVKFVRSSRYWARALDRLFPGRPQIGD